MIIWELLLYWNTSMQYVLPIRSREHQDRAKICRFCLWKKVMFLSRAKSSQSQECLAVPQWENSKKGLESFHSKTHRPRADLVGLLRPRERRLTPPFKAWKQKRLKQKKNKKTLQLLVSSDLWSHKGQQWKSLIPPSPLSSQEGLSTHHLKIIEVAPSTVAGPEVPRSLRRVMRPWWYNAAISMWHSASNTKLRFWHWNHWNW